jgi:hypothetical protein
VALDTTVARTWLKIEASQYANSSFDTRINYWLSQAEAAMAGPSVWLGQYTRAAMLWALHRMAVQDIITSSLTDPTSGSGGMDLVGALTSRKAREVSETYGSSAWLAIARAGLSAGDAFWRLTPYGLEWLAIRDTRPAAFPTTVGARNSGPADDEGCC